VDISFCKDLTDDAFAFLKLVDDKPAHRFAVQELVLAGCTQLSAFGISQVVSCCPDLQ